MERRPELPDGSVPGFASGAPLETPPPASSDAHLDAPDAERYARRQVLGVGGMGRVVLARDQRLDRDVALKEVAAQADPRAARALEARLAREAAVTARLEHPGIVPVYDAGRNPDGTVFYTMRVIRGRSLEDAVRGATDLDGRMRFLRHVLDASQAVAWAHRHGIVHRDLKPANIMVGEFGETQVVDWGLARPVAGADDPLVATGGDDAALTAAGAAVGTPHYMSPEQAMGQPADQRSDVWCLGFVLYEVLVGRRARPAASATDALAEARAALPALDLDGLPPSLAAIVRRATARRPAERYPDAKAFADDLAAYLDGRRVAAHAYTTWELVGRVVRAWRVPLTVALVALVAIGVALGVGIARTAAERDRADAQRLAAEAARARATEAERQTRGALERAEATLGRALVGSARALAERGALPEAEVTAASALVHAESPEARGLLAMLGGAERPRRVATYPLGPDCPDLALASDASLAVCDDGAWLHVRDLQLGLTRWATRLAAPGIYGASHTTLLERDGVVLARDASGNGFRWFDARTGADVGHDADCCRRYSASNDGLVAYSFAFGDVVARTTADALLYGNLACGEVIGFGAVDVDRDGRLRLFKGCDDGTFVTGALHGATTRGRFAADAPEHLAYAAALVPDADAVVVGSNKGEAALVALPSGAVLRRTAGLRGVVAQVGVSMDGGVAAIADEEHGVALWDLVTGASLGRLPASAHVGFRFVVGAPRRLAVWSEDELAIWDLPRGRPQRLPVAGGVSALDLAPDGRRLAVAATQEVAVHAMDDGRELARHHAPAIVKAVAWSADGDALAAGIGAQTPLAVFDDAGLAAGRSVGSTFFTRRLARTPAGALLRVADGGAGELAGLDGIGPPLYAAEESGRDLTLTAGRDLAVQLVADDRAVRLWLGGDAPVRGELPLDAACTALAVRRDGERLACADGTHVTLMDGDGRLVGWLAAPPDTELVEVAWSPDDRWIAGGSRDGAVLVWDAERMALALAVTAHAERVSSFVFDPGGRWLIAGGWDNAVTTFDLGVLDAPADTLLRAAERGWGITRAAVTGER